MRKLHIFTRALLILLLLNASVNLHADEGMWLPNLIQKLNIEDMQLKGLELSAEEIYSINNSSLKDAIVSFGGFCTGEVISSQGLILTNHHCGYGQIQKHSSVEKDYLKNGFWAMHQDQELANPGLTASFIVSITEVTDSVLSPGAKSRSGKDRQRIIESNINRLEKEAVKDGHYEAQIKAFFHGSRYFLILKEVFKDVRLVGAPPESIGKFGGDTDNWVWPRHTGDFSLFRIYADKNNMPAEYSKDNIPYTPKHHLPISLKGVEENDFTMVFGFPGRTNEYLISNEIDFIKNTLNPIRIHIRDEKMKVLQTNMQSSDAIRIKYSAKYARLSNYYKKWKGENMGLKRSRAIDKKQKEEADFKQWANDGAFADVYKNLEEYNALSHPYQLLLNISYEAGLGIDLIYFGFMLERFCQSYDLAELDKKKNEELKQRFLKRFKKMYKDFDLKTDKAVAEALLPILDKSLSEIKGSNVLYNGSIWADMDDYINKMYSKSFLTDSNNVFDFIQSYSKSKYKKSQKDIGMQSGVFIAKLIARSRLSYQPIQDSMEVYQGKYMLALIQKNKDRTYYPNANSTLRLAYGKVEPYFPKDGVFYHYQTHSSGILQKYSSGEKDYVIDERLEKLLKEKDFGDYEVNGKLPICFIASNHTTGGNSGSPVLNARGEFIGINFDRNWEGTMSDLNYDINICRNIAVDARYILFVIDKYAGATYLLDEMSLVR